MPKTRLLENQVIDVSRLCPKSLMSQILWMKCPNNKMQVLTEQLIYAKGLKCSTKSASISANIATDLC